MLAEALPAIREQCEPKTQDFQRTQSPLTREAQRGAAVAIEQELERRADA